ncbi:MAG: (2Fe-2S)-binding protein [Spirochaetales bacterium]|nr:(2Fe-2S)-binding protein [Spirochaetales bacterium]
MDRIEFTLNGEKVSLEKEGSSRLLDALREDFKLCGAKEGCGEGECGACSVLIDGTIANSCLVPLGNATGRSVVTIEGFSRTDRYRILESCFAECGAVQCGFCIPGMVIAAESLLNSHPHPGEEEIREGLSGNLCRCTGYAMIVEAVTLAAERGKGLW